MPRPSLTPEQGGVLIVGNFLSAVTSVRGVCEDLARALDQAGWRVLTTSARAGRWARFLDMLATVYQRRREYVVAQVDVESGNAFFRAETICRLLTRVGKPYVLTLHGGNLPHFAGQHPDRVRRLLASAAAVTAPSRFLQQALGRYGRAVELVPNALDLAAYPFALRRTLRPRLVWLRAFHAIYNPLLAVRVLDLLRQDLPELFLTMVGPDKGDGSFQAFRREMGRLGLEERVEIVGGVAKAEVPRWLSANDIFLNTTRIDNTPVSVLEAMACGLCVVSTMVGGIPDLLHDEHDALLVRSDHPPEMSAAVRRLFLEPELAARLSQNGRKTIETWDWSAVLPRWQHLLVQAAISRP